MSVAAFVVVAGLVTAAWLALFWADLRRGVGFLLEQWHRRP